MTRYAKGSHYEHELLDILESKGYSVIRAAGSGVSGVCPDILAFKKGRAFAFECKAWDRGSIGIQKDKFLLLKQWENNSGITTMIAWRVLRSGWFFMHLDELEQQRANYTITLKKASLINRKIEEIA